MQLEGKTALVTGGSAGIGFAAVQCLVREGAFVYVADRNPDTENTIKQAFGDKARGFTADVAVKDDLLRVADAIAQDRGRLDIVFANAGIGTRIALEDITEEDFTREFGVNVKGTLFTVQAALPLMTDGGSIVLNTSITQDMGSEAFSMYAASKAAVRSLARSWTTDLKQRRIRVNAVSPGIVPTEAYTGELGMTQEQVDEYARSASDEIPVGRVGTPRDIGEAVVFLASDASSFITGIELTVDGGMTQVYAGRS